MRKIKKTIALSLALAMGLSLVACGKKDEDSTTTAPTTESEPAATTDDNSSSDATSEEAPVVTEDQGKVYNIYVWNTEFQSRVKDYYPGYDEVDNETGKIGDITVKWNITSNKDNAYQNNLDETLLAQSSASDDDKVDMFLVEADYALKYVNADVSMPIADIGITDSDLSKQYQYTKDVVTDSEGALKGVSWQGCPAVMFYNRDIATEVLGSDDPDTVQEAVKDWDTFKATAATMKERGYLMSSSVMDTYRVFSNNVSSKWVGDDLKINIDDSIKTWVEMSKAMVEDGQATYGDLWKDEWSVGFNKDGGVFCYFGPMWEVNFSMGAKIKDENGNDTDEYNPDTVAGTGRWGACSGPQGFFWGGTWICAATGSDNTALTADIIKKLCCDNDIMTNIAKGCDEFVNNKEVISALASDTSYGVYTLGNQNPYALLDASASKINLSNLSEYDQACNEEFQSAMSQYFAGVMSYDEAIETFTKNVKTKHPDIVD